MKWCILLVMAKRKIFPLLLTVLCVSVVSGYVMTGAILLGKHTPEKPAYETGVLSIANISVLVEIPSTLEGIHLGLGNRDTLAENTGMLFLCLGPKIGMETPAMWMKGMRFPVDIIWIDENFTISDITRDVRPNSYPEIFTPFHPAAHVLEVNAGFALRHGISVGDTVFGLGGSSCGRTS